MGQFTLQDGRMRGDLIEPYKILCRTDKADGENTWCRFRIRLYCFQNADVEEFLLSQKGCVFFKVSTPESCGGEIIEYIQG